MDNSKNPTQITELATEPTLPRLMRLRQVLQEIPVSKSTWWHGVKTQRYPQPLRLGPRTTVWKGSDIEQLIRSLKPRGK